MPYWILVLSTRFRISFASLGIIVLISLFSSELSPYDPMRVNLDNTLAAPSIEHLLGTDDLGRDLLSRLLHGGRNTILISFCATLISVLPGAILGLLSISMSKTLNRFFIVIMNSILAVPGLLIGLIILTLFGQGVWQLILATGVTSLANYAQYTRSIGLSIKSQEYILASHAQGASKIYIMTHHILPNALPALTGYAGVIIGYSIITSTTFAFLGLTGNPGMPEWGVILAEGRVVLRQAPLISLTPSILIITLIFAVNSMIDDLFPNFLSEIH